MSGVNPEQPGFAVLPDMDDTRLLVDLTIGTDDGAGGRWCGGTPDGCPPPAAYKFTLLFPITFGLEFKGRARPSTWKKESWASI